MLGIGGFEVMCKIVCFIVDVKIIMFIVYIENFLLVKVMQVGVVGYFSKGVVLQEVVSVICFVYLGQCYIVFDIV